MCLAGSELRFAFSMRRVNLCKLCTLCAAESTWFCMNFHKLRLIGRRAALNLTQEELAKRAGVSLRSVAAWEAGTQQPTLRMVHLLATALGCPYAWLLGESESSMAAASENAPRFRSRTERVMARLAQLSDEEFDRIEPILLGIIEALRGGRAAPAAARDPVTTVDAEVARADTDWARSVDALKPTTAGAGPAGPTSGAPGVPVAPGSKTKST